MNVSSFKGTGTWSTEDLSLPFVCGYMKSFSKSLSMTRYIA